MITHELMHGTSDLEDLLHAFEDGTLTHDYALKRDPGDFGLGFYCTARRAKAASYGKVVLVQLDLQGFADIPNPYFVCGSLDPDGPVLEEIEPRTDAEKLFHDLAFDQYGMKTTAGALEDRRAAARLITERFLAAGYPGIRTNIDGDVVIFDQVAIKGIIFDLDEPIRQVSIGAKVEL